MRPLQLGLAVAAAKDNIADVKHELKGDIGRVQEQVNSIEVVKEDARREPAWRPRNKVFGAPRRKALD
jgi:hypothetical protein